MSINSNNNHKTNMKGEMNKGNSTTLIYNDTHTGWSKNINMRRDNGSS